MEEGVYNEWYEGPADWWTLYDGDKLMGTVYLQERKIEGMAVKLEDELTKIATYKSMDRYVESLRMLADRIEKIWEKV